MPRALSIPVYTDRPTGTPTSAVHSHCSAASASGPTITYLENDVWSNTVTPVRVVICSAADHVSQFGFPQDAGVGVTARPRDHRSRAGREQIQRLIRLHRIDHARDVLRAVDDVLAYLLAAMDLPPGPSRIFEIGGFPVADLLSNVKTELGLGTKILRVTHTLPRGSSMFCLAREASGSSAPI